MRTRAVTAGELRGAEYAADPYPVWRWLRDEAPLFHDGDHGLWMLSRYEDVVAVFKDHETYSNATYKRSTGKVFSPTMLEMDGQEHVRRRSVVAPEVVGNRLGTFLPMVERNVDELIATFAEKGEVELVSEFTTHLPINVISDLCALPGVERHRYHDWYRRMMEGLGGRDPEKRADGIRAHEEVCAFVEPVLEERRARPGDDLISKIVHASHDGHQLTDAEVKAFISLLLVAGGETTDRAIANLWFNLLSSPDQLAMVVEEPALLDAAFSETMRHSPPVLYEDRLTTRDVEWYGHELPAGSVVRVCIGSANTDDRVFEDPDRFDLTRADLNLGKELRNGTFGEGGRYGHLGFGIGKHFCLGYELARTEAVLGSRALLEVMGSPRIAAGSDPMPSLSGGAMRSVPELRVDFVPRR